MNRLLVLVLLLVAWLPTFAQGSYSVSNEAGFFARHPMLNGLLAGTIGFGLGVWFANHFLRTHYRNRMHQAFLQGRAEAPQVQLFKALTPPSNYELMLREENASLREQLRAFTQDHKESPPQRP